MRRHRLVLLDQFGIVPPAPRHQPRRVCRQGQGGTGQPIERDRRWAVVGQRRADAEAALPVCQDGLHQAQTAQPVFQADHHAIAGARPVAIGP
jgi:hypothetical protein